ncbi:TonB-dependent siderophore receptor [Methylophilus sp. 3sh_L]|uniref:TonB-dependent siderophore receptor n=1 Tax=Methylophilus sp. 3sh_L TaxID=3377114 RepID=UPI00398E76FA
MTPFRLKTSYLSLLLALPLSSAWAQGDSVNSATVPASKTTQDEQQTLGEVEVSTNRRQSFHSNTVQVGTFRDMDPLDVPLTVNTVTREVLDAQATNSLFGALRNTAGVSRSQLSGSTYDNIAIRGILVENRGNYRLNGSLPIINLIDTPLENKERVEVLKGASSLYYGLVPPSGIINLVTKRAGKVANKSLTLSTNQFGARSAHVDYGKRFGSEQQFGARFNVVTGSEDIGIDHYDGSRGLVSAALDWRANDKLSFKLDLEHYRKDVSEQAAIAVPAAVNGKITLPPVPAATQNLAGKWQHYDAEATNMLFRTDYAISDNWSWLFEAGRAKTERDRNFSQFQNFNPLTGEGQLQVSFVRNQVFTNTNFRTELLGLLETGPIKHQLTVGYTSNQREGVTPMFASTSVTQNYFNPRVVPVLAAVSNNRSSDQTILDRGLYVFDQMALTDQWTVMMGARQSRYDTETIATNAGTETTTRFNAKKVIPSVAVMYKVQPNISLYASYIEGFEDSGQAPANRANAGELLNPAKSRQKEIGVKTQVFNRFLLQLAYFDIERAAAFTNPVTNTFKINGDANYQGLEFAATGELTDRLSVAASFLLMDATLKTPDAASNGNTPENTPEKTASLFGEYQIPQIPGLFLSAGVFYSGKQQVNAFNQASIPGYTIGSVGARYKTLLGKQKATFQVVVDNVTDKDYWSTAGNSLLGVGRPRTLQANLRLDF